MQRPFHHHPLAVAAALACLAPAALAQTAPDASLPSYLADRGRGTPTSMFGTYVAKGELLLYPFVEYERSSAYDYNPSDFGKGPDRDFAGRYRAFEELIFLGYGLTEDLAIELEAAAIQTRLERSPRDGSALPRTLSSSGLGDLQTQVDWRFLRETATTPDLWAYTEVVFPHQQNDALIGTDAWETKFGLGAIKGFSWGTVSGRLTLEHAGSATEWGEWAVEYLKRLSPAWRLYGGVEGNSPDASAIFELQWHFSDHAFLKLNSAFGLTAGEPEWAPEVGVMFVF